jgi:hypothetical protein
VLGRLPDYITVSAYRVTPIVGVTMPPFDLRTDPSEVDSVFEVPLSFLMNAAHHERRVWSGFSASGELIERQFYSIPYAEDFIWGVTAGIVRNLFHVLNGRIGVQTDSAE